MTGEATERPLDVGREIVDVLARERTDLAGRAIQTVQRFFSGADTAVLRRRDLERFADWDADEREVAKEHWIETWAVDGRATVRELSQFRALVEADAWPERRDRLVRELQREILHNEDPLIRKALREIRDSVRKRQVPLLYPSGRPYGSRQGVQMLNHRQLELEGWILSFSGRVSESRVQIAEELADLRSIQVFESERALDPGRFISEDEASGRYVGRPGPMARSLDGGRVDSFEVMVFRGQAELDRFERRLLADPGFEGAAIERGWDLVREVAAGLRQKEHQAWLNWPFPSEMERLYPDETATARSAVAQVARNVRLEQTLDWAARWLDDPRSRVDRMIRRKVAEGAALAADTSELGGGTVSDAHLRLERLAERLRPDAEVSEASRNWAVDTFKALKKALGTIQVRANVLEHWALHRAAKVPVRAPPLSVVPSNLPVKAAKWAAGWVLQVERRVEAERGRSV